MPRHRVQDPQVSAPQDVQDSPEELAPATQEPTLYVPGVTEKKVELLERRAALQQALSDVDQELEPTKQEEQEKGREEAERQAKLAEARAAATREQDAILADVLRVLDLRQHNERYQRMRFRHLEVCASLGEQADDGVLNRHPLGRFSDLFAMFPPSEG